jgi:hypothetical protein
MFILNPKDWSRRDRAAQGARSIAPHALAASGRFRCLPADKPALNTGGPMSKARWH